MAISKKLLERYKHTAPEEMSLEQYLTKCKKDPSMYESPQERLLKAIGDPKMVDTGKDRRLRRIFGNQMIKTYAPFSDFYGMERTIEQAVGFIKHAAQGLEEKKQILYFLGPVGGGKSSLVERLKEIMESVPFYAIKGSPIFENPLGLFSPQDAKELGIPARYMSGRPSPWALKRLKNSGGDLSSFRVVKLYPSQIRQIAISKTEPGDENNQDISALVGKIDIRKVGDFEQNDPDAYSYSGGLCLGNRGIMEFVEMFKAPLKTLHPLLTATQEGNYNGTEAISAIPFEGIIIAHSNESEWQDFKNNKQNEAFLDRIHVVRVPYCLRITEEEKIYKKLLDTSSLGNAPCAPKTLNLLAQFTVASRLVPPENSPLEVKMKVYDGRNLKDTHPDAKTIAEYRTDVQERHHGKIEGFEGISTRFAFKVLSATFNRDTDEVSANPVDLLDILERRVRQEQYPEDKTIFLLNAVDYLKKEYRDFLEVEISKAYLDSYSEYGQNLFDRYVTYAEYWQKAEDYRDPDTGSMIDPDGLNKFLEEIEKPSGISNPESFRVEVVTFSYQHIAKTKKPLKWTQYKKMRDVIQKKIFTNTAEMLPVISSSAEISSTENKKKHHEFVERMMDHGYTARQVKKLVSWYIQRTKT